MAVTNIANLTSTITSTSGTTFNVSAKSNAVEIYDLTTELLVVKTTQKEWTIPGDKLTLTTTITNNLNTNISDITIKDTLGTGAKFVEGTLKVGTESYPDDNPITGATLPVTVGGQGGELTFSYEVAVDDPAEVETFVNQSNVQFEISGTQYNVSSNEVSVHILDNQVYLLKTADKTIVKSQDVVTFTIRITNDGGLENTNMMFSDPLPTGVTFVGGSVKIDDEVKADLNPTTGFALSNLAAGGQIKIEFQVTID